MSTSRLTILLAFTCGLLPVESARGQAATAAKPEAASGKKQYEAELNEIKQGLQSAKENLSTQQKRLAVVKGTPVNQPPRGNSRLAIVYRNDMTSLFVPIKYEVTLDGYTIYSKSDPIAFGPGQKEVELYRATLPEGEHQLNTAITMKGNGYGAFSYLKDYKFIGRAGHVFNVKEDKLTQVKIVTSEKSAAQPKDRPTIEFQDTNWNVNVPSPSN